MIAALRRITGAERAGFLLALALGSSGIAIAAATPSGGAIKAPSAKPSVKKADAPTPILASASVVPPAVRPPVAVVLDVGTNTMLLTQDADRPIRPASMAKVMTARVVFDQIKAGRLTLDTNFKVSSGVVSYWAKFPRASSMHLRTGQVVTVRDLLFGLMTVSGNDAATVLCDNAIKDAGCTDFVAEMNATARRLGMATSRFGNPSGWPDGGKTVTTARDLAVLASATLRDHPKLSAAFFGKPSLTFNGVTQRNRNPLIGTRSGVTGLKTGHTTESGYGLIATVVGDGRTIVAVSAGNATEAARAQTSRALADWAFAAWEPRTLFAAGAVAGSAPVSNGKATQISLVSERGVVVVQPRGTKAQLKSTVRLTRPLKAPVTKGDTVGELVVTGATMTPQRFPLVAGRDVPVASALDRFLNGWGGGR